MALCLFGGSMNRSSLRRQLVLPYVVLVIFVSSAIGWVSYRTGVNAVEALERRVLADSLHRVGTAMERHLSDALIALHAVVPDAVGVTSPPSLPDDPSELERRLWAASGLFKDVNNYIYFGGEDGRFIGVKRVGRNLAELSLRQPGAAPRRVYAAATPGDHSRLLRNDRYDPRTRPWYRAALKRGGAGWSPVYSDFSSMQPTITLAEPVYRADRGIAGVLATDVTLKALTDSLRAGSVGEHGVAFVIDGDGRMIANSGKEAAFTLVDGVPRRKRAEDMRDPLVRTAWRQLQAWRSASAGAVPAGGRSSQWTGNAGDVGIAAGQSGRRYGVDWITVVAVPRTDFMAGATRSLVQGVVIAVLCVLLALVTGLLLLNRVLKDLRKLTDAARRIGDGEPLPSLNIRRRDEIGQLAMRFSEMEHNLRIDKLTAVFNRASLIAQIGFLRRQLAQNPADKPSFALLFIDLDHFKTINDQYGHGAGDRVLVTVATRLKESVRVTDVVARYGGDEFVVLLKGVRDVDDIIATECKIREIVEEPVKLDHGIACVGVSIGWALFPEDGEDVDALLKIADQRMFDTKRMRKAERRA